MESQMNWRDRRESKGFGMLVRENSRMLMVYLGSLINDEAAVDDLFQETMLVAWRRMDDCDLTREFGPWLRGIASRLVMAHFRKKKKLPVLVNPLQKFFIQEVHVSSDLSRFRSGLPGREPDFPFINLHEHVQQLNLGYDIELSGETIESSDGRKLSQLNATRKSFDVRGPVEVTIWFDTATGVVYQMLLDKLPRRGGGPKSVRLELLNPADLGQTDFGPDFFSHDSHHEPFREVRYEVAK